MMDSFEPYPHVFVLCCLMDRQVNADKAWRIPLDICNKLGYDIEVLNGYAVDYYEELFNQRHLHRYNSTMARVFKSGIERISKNYDGDASKIWKDMPNSATVICRFLAFDGCGVKIATMATNLLYRAFGVQYSDYSAIDVSPDVHIMRVMYRLGILAEHNNREMAVYSTRGLYPAYPGLFDGLFWHIGKDYCHPSKPNCTDCSLQSICSKRLL